MAFMAANDPNVIVRTVTLPALPAPPAKVIVLDGSERLLQTARHRIAGTEPGVALLEARNATGILVGRDGTRHATTNLLALVA